ncbi:MAG TPA: hypothetical protein ENJ11_03370, partial [Gammaproteobacteria bacterium]|nr:hypothetical protein [Gammaproteobacteria bacterium]
NVVVSVKPVYSIVTGLMKDIASPELLIDGGQTPFDFSLRPEQQARMKKASLVIWVGPELEKSLQETIKALPDNVRVIELLSQPDLKILPAHDHPDRRNPFFWMDDRNVIIMLDLLTAAFIEMDPARSHIYQRNRLRLLKPLKRIDREYEYGYRGLKSGNGVQYYDVLYYFEQAYALTVLEQVADTPWDRVSAAALLRVRSRITSGEASCLFLDRSMPADNLDLLTEGTDINIGKLDVLGRQFEADESLYIRLMNFNTDVIKQCLNADMNAAEKARLAASMDTIPDGDSLGGRFILTNQYGQLVTEEDLKKHYSLIYFGYTSCPDVCPNTLSVVTRALKKLGEKGEKIQPYFITVDPERDTVAVMRDYVKYFDPRLVGLTGSPEMIERVAKQFKVRFEKGKVDPEHPDQYTMDHSSGLYLMAPDGRFITKLAYGISADTLAQKLIEYTR